MLLPFFSSTNYLFCQHTSEFNPKTNRCYLTGLANRSPKKVSKANRNTISGSPKVLLRFKRKTHLPSLFYKKVYQVLKEKSIFKRSAYGRIFKKFINPDTAANNFLKSKWVSPKKRKVIIGPRKTVASIKNPFLSSYLYYNLDKFYLKNKKASRLRIWKAKRKWAWKYLKRLRMSKKLHRTYGRLGHWSLARLNYFYFYDLFIFWFVVFFKRLENFFSSFYFSLWSNVYFSLKTCSNAASYNITSRFGLVNTALFSYYALLTNMRVASLVAKHLVVNSFFIYGKPSSYTRFFKFISLFWNKHKSRAILLGINSRNWKFKYNTRSNKLAKWRKRKIRLKYFFSKKLLRLRFRRQHGYHIIRNYPLITQIRLLKNSFRKFVPISKKPRGKAVKRYDSLEFVCEGKRVLGCVIKNDVKKNWNIKVCAKRRAFFSRLISSKQSLINSIARESPRYRKLARELELLHRIRNNFNKFSQHKNFTKLINLLVFRKIIVLKGLDKSVCFQPGLKGITLSRKSACSRLALLANMRFVMRLFSWFILRFFKRDFAQKHFSCFKQLVVFRLDKFFSNRSLSLAGLERRVLHLGIKYLNGLLGKSFLNKYIRKNFVASSRSKSTGSPLLMFLRKRLVSLKNNAALRLGRRAKKSAFHLRAVLRQKEQLDKRPNYSLSSFGMLYSKLVDEKLSLKFLRNLKSQNKNRKRWSKINRRKLLVVNSFKKILWKHSGSPLFLSKINKITY